jgi:uncharacterized membrane protein YhaH (DUF805 family)
VHYYIEAFRRFADFNGRSRRAAYWYFVLFNIVVGIAISVPETLLGLANPETGYGPFSGLYSLVVFLPSLAVLARRLHDIGRSGWWILIIFLPIVGFFVLLYWTVKDSEAGANAYGPNPKAAQTGFEAERP